MKSFSIADILVPEKSPSPTDHFMASFAKIGDQNLGEQRTSFAPTIANTAALSPLQRTTFLPQPPFNPYGMFNPRLRKHRSPRKSRTAFSPRQVTELEERFAVKQYLTCSERIGLSAQLELTDAQIKIWFQNRRAKERRIKHNRPSEGYMPRMSLAPMEPPSLEREEAANTTESAQKQDTSTPAAGKPIDNQTALANFIQAKIAIDQQQQLQHSLMRENAPVPTNFAQHLSQLLAQQQLALPNQMNPTIPNLEELFQTRHHLGAFNIPTSISLLAHHLNQQYFANNIA